MKIKTYRSLRMDNLSYLLLDEKSGDCAVIDPSWSSKEILSEIEKEELSLKAVLLTHGHYDHSEGIDLFENRNAEIFLAKEDLFLLPYAPKNPSFLEDGKKINLFEEPLTCIHTPGHSPGSYCFLFKKTLFTGDTLFPGCCGRADLPGSSPKELRKSLIKISKLPQDIEILSGHFYNGGKSDIKTETETNPCFLNINDEDAFINEIL